MDQALKQRLIGAAVLVALAVIFVPMLLDAPEPTSTPAASIPLDIPAEPGAPLQTREIPLSLPAAPTPAATAPTTAGDPNQVVTVDADVAPKVDALAGDPATAPASPATSAPTAAAPATVPAAPAASAPSMPVAASTPAPDAATPAPTPTPEPAAAPAMVAPAAVPAAAAGGRFVVNLGSFGNAENATALRQRLSQRGIAVIAETISVDGKPVQRLRAGPYRSRAEAEAAQLAIAKSEPGNSFLVVELDAVPAAVAPSRAGAAFAVQVGALKDEAEANALRDRLRAAGFAAYVARAATDAGVLWRVRAGPELDRARAEQVRSQLKAKLQLDGLVVPHP